MVQAKEYYHGYNVLPSIAILKNKKKGGREIDLQLTKMIKDNQSRSELDPAF